MPQSPMGWYRMTPKADTVGLKEHFLPVDDIHTHEMDVPCWCNPAVDECGMIIHNAYDQRELIELGQRRIQ